MDGHLSKHVKMHKKPTSGTNKHGKHRIVQSKKKKKKGKGMHEATGIMAMHLEWLHPNKATWASDVTT